MSSGPLSDETIQRLQRASEAVRFRRSEVATHQKRHRTEQREREQLFPDYTPTIQCPVFPGATPGINWQHLLVRTAESCIDMGRREEARYWMQAKAIVGEAQEQHWTVLVEYLAKLLLMEDKLHKTHGEQHNPYLEGILRSLSAGEPPKMPKRIK